LPVTPPGKPRAQSTDAASPTTAREVPMIKVKTFTTPIKMFATVRELTELDEAVTTFLGDEKATTVYSVSDSTTAGDNGETIGLMRAVAYDA
jgi:hypothetical protein